MITVVFNQKGGETNIICTQPRRISAIGLAERVANERDEKVGGVVGYSVRLESKTSKETRLLFCTTGILLRRLLSDSTLENVTHVILDEVHERSVNSDVLLLLLRRVVQKRPKLKLVLMSATADADLFADYFQTPSKRSTENGIKAVKTSKITIPGFTHPVKEYYLEDVFNETSFLIGQKSKYAKNAAEKKRQLALLESEEDSVDPNAFLPSSSDDDDEDDAHRARGLPGGAVGVLALEEGLDVDAGGCAADRQTGDEHAVGILAILVAEGDAVTLGIHGGHVPGAVGRIDGSAGFVRQMG